MRQSPNASSHQLDMPGQPPAQEIHVLVNPNNADISPWYKVDFGEEKVTPE
ncbi:MAG: hypothetical protein IPN76_23465 [Saprospiraceae bacterium]|nr:hypothetical protein [Saprospiraceae bacterium]